jgi:hypothetical protein
MQSTAKSRCALIRKNRSDARTLWPKECTNPSLATLRELTTRFLLSVALGEIRLLDGSWYITHSGLLSLASRRRCRSIQVRVAESLSDPGAQRWVVRACVGKSVNSNEFMAYGDADPSNVSPMLHGSELRIAETRAVNRALRKAYGIGLCSMEELGWTPRSVEPKPSEQRTASQNGNGNHHHHSAQPRLRDRLCLLIRQHKLDPNLVKAYAADYCGTVSVRDASRELVEAFINDLAEQATKDRDALICHLNSYAKPQEVHS